jgi:hypothetical protein
MLAYLRWLVLVLSACQTAGVQIGDIDFTRVTIRVGDVPTAAATGDLNGDGHQDLVVANQLSHDLTILLGDGTGNLADAGRVAGGENPGDVALADLNEDGSLDVVVPNHDTDHLTILLGDGSGGFRAAPNSPLVVAVTPHPHAVHAVDINTDGHADLVVDDRGGEGLLLLRGLGDGSFAGPGHRVAMGGDPYRGMAIADIDRDGRLDLATPNPDHVGIAFGTDTERFEFSRTSRVTARAPFAVALADVSGDGIVDLVIASETARVVRVLLGDGTGAFAEKDDSPIDSFTGAKRIVLGDFNGDGVQDAAIPNYMSSDVLLLLGGPSIGTGSVRGGEHPWGAAAADLNQDGRDDLVLLDYGSSEGTLYLSRHE